MPCYSKIQTVLISLPDVQSAAQALGMTVTRRSQNRYTISHNGERIDIERPAEGEKFETVAYSGSANWPTAILQPLVSEYAKVRTKALMRSKGYTASQGTNPNELVFTAYR